jgi:hypothetical protein
MELDLSVAPIHRRDKHRPKRMQTRRQSNWRLVLALILDLIVALGWGFLLGVGLVRINTQFLLIGMVLVALPSAFVGSVLVSVSFHMMLPAWHKMVRLLLLILIVAAGTPLGLAWGVYEQQLDPVPLVNGTGAMIWDAEWFFALLGLIAGTWPGWARPLTERLKRLLGRVFDGPARLLRFIAALPGRIVEAIAQFFENVGHGFLWLPLKIGGMIASIPRRVLDGLLGLTSPLRQFSSRVQSMRMHSSPPAMPTVTRQRSRRQSAARAPRVLRRRTSAPKSGNHGEGPRVLSVVEDRCPYCFDVIKRNDPRGVQVCEVCGTPHHADCWAITGKCQVPHLNT